MAICFSAKPGTTSQLRANHSVPKTTANPIAPDASVNNKALSEDCHTSFRITDFHCNGQ